MEENINSNNTKSVGSGLLEQIETMGYTYIYSSRYADEILSQYFSRNFTKPKEKKIIEDD